MLYGENIVCDQAGVYSAVGHEFSVNELMLMYIKTGVFK